MIDPRYCSILNPIVQKFSMNTPQFDISLQLELCQIYDKSLKISKIAVLLSTLYNIYFPYVLYRSSILPVIMMAIVSSVLFFTNWTRDSFSVQVIGASLVTVGFLMIIGQYVLPNLDVHLSNLTSKIRRWFSNDHAYENIPPNQEEHEDFIFVNPI
ncbi:unnamed protein product [Rotaria socialis]|uniref:Uncharacterized protein n=1 Tax=Rotaria socialis TaxID=392032 RepID=A0A818N3X7_9BILA|nr:unnamed protein product [Rotaria socialis]